MGFKQRLGKLSGGVKLVGILVILGVVYLIFKDLKSSATSKPTYQTAQVTTGTLVVTISGSGSITSSNSDSVTTTASGTVTQVYVKNGDTVTEGQKLADITPDQDSSLSIAKNYSSYLSAKNALASVILNKESLAQAITQAEQSVSNADSTATTAQQSYGTMAGNGSDKQKAKLTLDAAHAGQDSANQSLDIAKQKYAQADDAITLAQASLNTAWLTYEQSLPTITAPSSGVLSNFTLAPGSVINAVTTTSSNSSTTQTVGTITLATGTPQAQVNLTEIDVVNVAAGQKATLTLGAFPDKTFTGKVLAINTSGTSSSGVTSYPTTIVLDSSVPGIYPNMSVSAKIITKVDQNVLLVPSSAIQTANGVSTVRTMNNGQLGTVTVTLGDSDDTNTVVTSGLSDGDTVVTSVVSPNSTTTSSGGSSIFSSLGGNRGGFGGGAAGGAVFRTTTGR